VERALAAAQRLIIVIGSADKPRSIKNPWNSDERMVMIRRSLSDADASRVRFGTVCDALYNDEQWMRSVQDAVNRLIGQDGGSPDRARVGLIGHEKDASSHYLHMFPQWPRVESADVAGLSATQIRDAFLDVREEAGNMMLVESGVPAPVYEFLKSFRSTDAFSQLAREYEFIRAYRRRWETAPYPPTFVTVDAVVVHSGHVLLVRRRAAPGKGLWAWPGGFLDPGERILDAAIRELREETRLRLPVPVLKGSIRNQRVFDHPDRSARGRTITHAYLFEFPAGELPEIKGADDVDKARWVPLSQFFQMRHQMFEDHFDIGSWFLGSV
jgi:bifunctional NMN adenylyltransferase/nudix hydrolase